MAKQHQPFKQCNNCNRLTGGKEEITVCAHCGSDDIAEPSDELPFVASLLELAFSTDLEELKEDIAALMPEDVEEIKAEFNPSEQAIATAGKMIVEGIKVLTDTGKLDLSDIGKIIDDV